MGDPRSPRIAVVTGGAGFIGSHLTELLVREGLQVRVIDDFCNGREKNLEPLKGSKAVSVLRADVVDHAKIAPAFQGADWVFHLAALADIVPSIERPLEYHRANVDGTASVLEAARAAGVKRFVYTASSSCYGLARTPTGESEPVQPMYPYAHTKWVGEQYALHWGKVYGLPVVSLRLFNVYGPRSRTSGTYGAVFGVFLAQKLAGKPFTVVGDGTQTRDFVFVTDVAQAFLAAARSEAAGEVFNVGAGSPQSVNRLVELLGGPTVRLPKRPGEPDCTHADISKIKKVLGWSPKVSFEQGVAEMLRNIDYWRDAPVWDERSIAAATKQWFDKLSEKTPVK